MSDGVKVLGWWRRELADRNAGRARALAARLRHAGPVDALAERAVQDLARDLRLSSAGAAARLSRLVRLLAEVREHTTVPLARRLGGRDPVMSALRFQRLMRADEDELTDAMRRAIILADRTCNVAALAGDLMYWGDRTKTRWCFDYYGEAAPDTNLSEAEA